MAPPTRAGQRALALEVQYLREGVMTGNLFIHRRSIDCVELTTPWGIIEIPADSAFELWGELQRLFGFKIGLP